MKTKKTKKKTKNKKLYATSTNSVRRGFIQKIFANKNTRIAFVVIFATVGIYLTYNVLAATSVSSTAYCINGTMASGERTHDGAAAKNGVPFGTQYKILSGSLSGKIVTIKDRSAPGATGLDIWMASCTAARNYGRQTVSIEQVNTTSNPVGGGEAPCSHPTISRSNTGGRDCVRHLQAHLNNFGYGLSIDGLWGNNTDNAVRDFQRKQGFGGYGKVGPSTWDRLHGGSGSPNPAPPQQNQPPSNQPQSTGGDRLSNGQTLGTNQSLSSQNGQYVLRMQSDGNLVVYASGNRAIWSSRTSGSGARLVMQGDGNLVVYRGSTPLWASGTNGKGASFATMQNDGNFVVYTNSGRPTWSSKGGLVR